MCVPRAAGDRQDAVRRENARKPWHHQVPIHPVQTVASSNQRIGSTEIDVFDGAEDPRDVRGRASSQTLSELFAGIRLDMDSPRGSSLTFSDRPWACRETLSPGGSDALPPHTDAREPSSERAPVQMAAEVEDRAGAET